MGAIVPADDLPDNLVPEDDMPSAEDTDGLDGFWYSGKTNIDKSILGAPGELSRTMGNDLTRGILRAPSNIVAGLPTLAADVVQRITGTPWEKTTKVEDWAPAISQEATDNLFSKTLGLYSTKDPNDLRRYPGRASEFIGNAVVGGGAKTLTGLLGAMGGGVGAQAGQDLDPESKYSGPIGGILGLIAGGKLGNRFTPPPPADASPSMSDLKSIYAKEVNDPNITTLSPGAKAAYDQSSKIKAVDTALQTMKTDPEAAATMIENLKLTPVEQAHMDGVQLHPALKSAATHGATHIAHALTGIPKILLRIGINNLTGKRAVDVKTQLEQLKDVIRTQKPIPRHPGFIKNSRGILGVLQQGQ